MDQVLRKLTPAEEEEKKNMEEAKMAAKAKAALEVEKTALDKVRLEAQSQRQALAMEQAALRAKKEAEESFKAELLSAEAHFEVVYPSVAIRSASVTHAKK